MRTMPGASLMRCAIGCNGLRCRSIRTKAELIEFGRFARRQRSRRRPNKPETFNFLGFTFVCGQSRRGRFLLKRKSRGDRTRTKLKELREEMRSRRHQPVPEQGQWLGQV